MSLSLYILSKSLLLCSILSIFSLTNPCDNTSSGNKLIKKIVNIINGLISRYGILARYGGDEFSVLLPETDLNRAIELAEEIRKAVESCNDDSGIDILVSTSIGVSSFPETATDFNAFKEKADASLYKAKKSGKNFVAYVE